MFKKAGLPIANALIENSTVAIIMLDMDGIVIEWNPAAEHIFGWTREEVMGKPNPIVPGDKQDEYVFLRGQVAEGKPYSGKDLLRQRKDGTLIHINMSSSVLYDEKGNKIGTVGIAEDITERVKIEEDRRLLTELIDASPASITVHDFEGNFLYANQKTFDLHGFTKEEFLSKRLHEVDAPATKELIAQRMKELSEKGGASFEVVHYRKDGTTFPLMVYAKTCLWNNRKVIMSVATDITDRNKTAEALQESEDKFRSIFEEAIDGIMIADAETKRQIEVNKSMCLMLGYTRDEIIGLSVDDIHPKENLPAIRSIFERQLRGETSLATEIPMLRKDGSVFYADINATHVTLGGKQCLAGIFRDITKRKQADAALRERGKQLAESQRIAHIGSWEHNLTTGKVVWSDELFRILGLDPRKDPADFKMFFEMIHPDDQPALKRAIEETIETGKHFSIDYRLNLRDGRARILHAQAELIHDETGTQNILSGTGQDITERKLAEEKVRQSEERYRSLFEDSSISLWEEDISDLQEHFDALRSSGIKDFHTYFTNHPEEVHKCLGLVRIISVNKATLELYEASGQALLLQDLSRVFTEQSFESFREILVSLAEGARSYECEAVNKTLKGREINVLLRWSLLDQGSHALVSVVDITDRKEAEEKLRRSEEFIRGILDTVDEGLIVIDRDFRILTTNKAYCSQVGESCDKVIGRHCYEISHKTLRPCYEEGEECAVRQVFETGEPHTALHKHPDAKGSVLYVETKAFPIKDSTGAVTSVIETVNNITEKHLLEEEQMKTEKLEAIGTLAGGIAHDFNNLLQGVFGYISMAKMTLDQKKRSLEMLEQAEKALHMSVNLTSQLLTFSKGGKPLKKKVPLQSVIENSAKFALSGSNIDLHIKLYENLWMVEVDEGQIGQVIQNIVLNAEQAMPMGGAITITGKNVSSRQKGLPLSLQQGNYVEISIEDTGVGIPEQYLPRIFDPYFTTKDKGSGLGLATSYSIIKNHGGLIDVKSKPGEGTTFFVYLPAVEVAGTSAVTVSEDIRALRKGRILLMDDEDIVRAIAGVMIKSLGHEVELAENGKEAIEKYRESIRLGRQFDIVIIDLTIRGGMGGEEAIKELLEIDPDIKAIVSSGYTDSSALAEYKKIGFRACLIKPYDIVSLNNTLNTLLD